MSRGQESAILSMSEDDIVIRYAFPLLVGEAFDETTDVRFDCWGEGPRNS